jgi:hypothetical protein
MGMSGGSGQSLEILLLAELTGVVEQILDCDCDADPAIVSFAPPADWRRPT